MIGRRDPLILVVLTLLVTAISATSVCAAEPPPASVQQAKGFGSPAEAWKAYIRAGEAKDWGRLYDCLTPAAQDGATFDCLLGLMMGIEWFNLRKADDAELRSIVKRCDDLFSAHGVAPKQIEKEAQTSENAGGGDLDRADLQKISAPDER